MTDSIKLIFRNDLHARLFVMDLESLNKIAKDSVAYDVIRDQWEKILDYYIQCRHRDCGLCNGVACEKSVEVEIPNSLLTATKAHRDKATSEHGVSETQAQQWDDDDRGKCHW